jgi:hypothetical protein
MMGTSLSEVTDLLKPGKSFRKIAEFESSTIVERRQLALFRPTQKLHTLKRRSDNAGWYAEAVLESDRFVLPKHDEAERQRIHSGPFLPCTRGAREPL